MDGDDGPPLRGVRRDGRGDGVCAAGASIRPRLCTRGEPRAELRLDRLAWTVMMDLAWAGWAGRVEDPANELPTCCSEPVSHARQAAGFVGNSIGRDNACNMPDKFA